MENNAMKVRLVHCPNCWKLLVELPDVSLYRCGNCAVTLVAKCHNDGKKNVSESSEKISRTKDEPSNQGDPYTYSETETEMKCEEQNSRLLEDSIMENKHEMESDKKGSTSTNMKLSTDTEQSELGEEETLTGMKTLHPQSGIGVIKNSYEENYVQENNACNPESSTKYESLILSKKKLNRHVLGAIFLRTHQYEEEEEEEEEEESRNPNASSSYNINFLVSEDTYFKRTGNEGLQLKEESSVQRDECSGYQERLLHDIKNISLTVGQHEHDHAETNSKMEETVKPVPHPDIYETYITNIQHTTEHNNPPRKESKISNDYHNHNARSSKQANVLSNQLNENRSSGHVVCTGDDTNKNSKQMNMDEYNCSGISGSRFYQRHQSNIYQKQNTSNYRQPYILDSQKSCLPKYKEYLKEGQRIFPRKEKNCDFTSRTNGWHCVPEFPMVSVHYEQIRSTWDFWEPHQARNSESSNYQPELNEMYVPTNCMPHMFRYQQTPILGSPPSCSHLSNSCSYWYSDNHGFHEQIPHSYHCNGNPCNLHLTQTYSQSCSSHFSNENCKNPPGHPIKKQEFQILSYREANSMSKHHWRSLAGGSPFFFCDNCFKLLHLPSHSMFPKKIFDKIRCGSCSKILILDHTVKHSHSDLRSTDSDGISHTLRRNKVSEEHVNNFLQRERISSFDRFFSSNNDPTVSRNQMSGREKALPEEFESNSMGHPGVSSPHVEQFEKSSLRRRENSFHQGQSMNTYFITDNHMDRKYLADSEIKEKESLTSRSSLIKNGTQEMLQGRVSEKNVYVNDKLISYHEVKRAEKKAGPIQPGRYWYDIRAGFWGRMGQPCRGVIPAFIKEFDHPMSRNCAGGSTGFIVNGRELHHEDLNLLLERGLPTTGNKEYIIEKDGQIFNKESRRDLGYIINFAPTVEKIGRGFGMF